MSKFIKQGTGVKEIVERHLKIDSDIINVKVLGETTEIGTGDKSPDNPYELVGSKPTKVTVCGRNLYDGTDYFLPNALELNSLSNGISDEYDTINGILTKRIDKVMLDGSEDEGWNIHSINSYGIVNFRFEIFKAPNNNDMICDYFIRSYDSIANSINENFYFLNNILYLRLLQTRIGSIEELRIWLIQNPITILYKLEIPTIIKLEQLIDIQKNINVFVDSGIVKVIPISKGIKESWLKTATGIKFVWKKRAQYEGPYTLTSLSVARTSLTSSPLADGVIVSGGRGIGLGHRSSVSDYYNNEKVRTTLTSLSMARETLTSSPLADGVIVSGGRGSSYTGVSDYYNNEKVRTTLAPLSPGREKLTSSPLADGVIVSGGYNSSYTNASNYYNNEKVRTTLTSLSVARADLTSSPLADGVIVSGGRGSSYTDVSDYYNNEKVRTTLAPLSPGREKLTSSPLADGVIVSGGYSVDTEENYIYTNASDYYNNEKIRTTLTSLSVARTSLTSSPLADGVIVSGGRGSSYTDVSDYYNNEKVRTTLAPLSPGREKLTSSPLADGVIVSGGYNSSYKDVSDYYNNEKVRTTLATLSIGRASLTSSPLADGVIVSGGYSVDIVDSITGISDYYPARSVIPQE